MRFVAARCQQTILPEVHQNPGLIWAVTAPQVRTLLALEVRLDVGFLDEAVWLMPCKSRRRAAKRRSIRGHMPIPGWNCRWSSRRYRSSQICGATAGGCISPL